MPNLDMALLTTGDVARRTGWTIGKVRALCESGKLPAVDTSTGKRPRWSIREIDLEAFLTPGPRYPDRNSRPRSRRSGPKPIDADVPKVF